MRRLIRRVLLPASVCAVILLLLAGCGLFPESDHTTSDEVRELTYPDRVERVGWEWQPSDGARIVGTVPVPPGVAVVLDDGYAVLAGDTGEELWRYRSKKAALAAYASRDGQYLALEVEEPEAGSLLLRFNSSMGEIVEGSARDKPGSEEVGVDHGSFRRSVGEGTMVVRSSDGPALTAFSLETGEPVWTREEPAECTTADDLKSSTDDVVVLDDVVVEAFTCAPSVVRDFTYTREEGDVVISGLLGRDLRTGEELWRSEEDFGIYAFQSIDHRSLDPLSEQHLVMRTLNSPNVVFDVSTGEVIGEWDGAVLGVLEDGSVVVWYPQDREYRREETSGEILDSVAEPNGADRSDYPVALEDGVVGQSEAASGEPVRMWFHAWGDDEPTLIDVGDAEGEGEKAVPTIAVPGAVVLGFEGGKDGESDVLVGLV